MTIYILKNFTLKEQYLGAAAGDTHAAVKAHKANPLSPVSHWKWDSEKIQWGEIQADLPAGTAVAYLAALRREPLEEGWVQVFGGEDLTPQDDVLNEEEWLPPPD